MRKAAIVCITLIAAASAMARTITVDDDAPADFNTIQAAINDARSGDTVQIQPGTYTGEGNRDITFHGRAITLTSIDPCDPAVVASTVIDCQKAARAFNLANREGPDSIIQGLTITEGYALGDLGGGIRCDDTSPTIRYCTIMNSAAELGGAIAVSNGNTAIINCTLTSNHAAVEGGAIFFEHGTNLLSNCLILNNSAEEFAGACGTRRAHTSIKNCIIAGNTAGTQTSGNGSGGAFLFWEGTSTIVNCTIIGNSASDTGGAISCKRTDPAVRNSIIRNNTAPWWPGLFPDCVVSYSNIQGGYDGTGNIDSDPLFIDLAAGNYHLAPASPCIDTGDPAYAPAPGETDIDGEPRHLGLRVDMGADESLNDVIAIGVFPDAFRFDVIEGQSSLPQETLQIWNTGIGILNWQIEEDCPWLRAEPREGTYTDQPNEVLLTADTASLDWGLHNCRITVSDPTAINSPRIIDVVLNFIGPEIGVSRENIIMETYEGDTSPRQETLAIYNDGGGTLYWQAAAACDWLDITPLTGTSTGDSNEITLTTDASALPHGIHFCNITISDPNDSNRSAVVPVKLEVLGPKLSVSSTYFNFEAGNQSPVPPDQILKIANTGGGTLDWHIVPPNDCNWLTIRPLAGQVTRGQIEDVNLAIDATNLELGSYYCLFEVHDPEAANSPKTIRLNLNVRAPNIWVIPAHLKFRTWHSDPCLPQQTISIRNWGVGTLDWHIAIPPECSWLDAQPGNGRSQGEPNIVTLTVDASTLDDGYYDCNLVIIDPNASNSPEIVNVRLLHGIEEGLLLVPSDFPTIQSAVDWALPGEEVIVAPGTYTGPGNRDIQVIDKPITIRSIDPTDPAIVASTVIDCNGRTNDQHRGFYIETYISRKIVLSGLTITNGYTGTAAAIYCRANNTERTQGLRIENCIITNNFAEHSTGAIYAKNIGLTIENCIFSDNSAINKGAVIRCRYSDVNVINCTIVANTAWNLNGTALNCAEESNLKITNSILYFNSDPDDYMPSIFVERDSAVTISYSNIQDGSSAAQATPDSTVHWDPGNISTDPCFVDPGYWDSNDTPEPEDDIRVQGNYRLKSEGWRWDAQRQMWIWDNVTSPCIDAGNPISPLAREPLSVPADPNNEWGQNIRINMGAFGGTPLASIPPLGWALPSDYDNDGLANFTDLAHIAQNQIYAPAKSAHEPNQTYHFNAHELQGLAECWLDQTIWFGTMRPPTPAWNPSPPDGLDFRRNAPDSLTWSPGLNAESHDVYFGPTDPPEFQTNQTETTFPLHDLEKETTYYWRIDEIGPDGTIRQGQVWNFTTSSFGKGG